jgi:hypothetical protein
VKKVVLISVFAGLTLFVIVVIVRVLIYANNIDATLEPLELNKQEQNFASEIGSKWAQELANVKQREFSAAVNDLYLSSKLIRVIKDSERVYQLTIDKADRYSLFCIDRVLINQKIKYSLTRDSKSVKLFVVSHDKKKLQQIVQELKKYEINSNLKEVTAI